MDVSAILEQFVELLKEERYLLGKTLSDATYAEALEKVTSAKGDILASLSTLDPDALESHKAAIESIRELSSINMQLAQSNMLFIEELFGAIFKDSGSQYDQTGTVSSKKEGLINKKI